MTESSPSPAGAGPMAGPDRFSGSARAHRSAVIARQGMAATSQPLATQAAIDILRSGGNAVDAAIAANAVLAVVEPHANGLGGDLFATVWDARTHRLHALNASGRSPRELGLETLRALELERLPDVGPLTVSTPGAVDGWCMLQRQFGSLALKRLLQQAIEYARTGFPVSEVIAHEWAQAVASIADQPGYADVFLPGGRAPTSGEIFSNPALADSLERISDRGRDGFYTGRTAREMVEFTREAGGYLSLEDLAVHRSSWVSPLASRYRGYEVWELPPNSQGIAALQMLNILEGYDLAALGFGHPDYLHLLIETKKLVHEDRARYYADPDFHSIPLEALISKEYAAERRASIDPGVAARNCEPGMLDDGDTVYLATADRQGNMVSLIQSLYGDFGSGVTPPALGFALQNRGSLFSLHDGHPNQYAPCKRPFHTLMPGFVTRDGRPYLSFGVMGGSFQPLGHVQVLINHIDFGMDVQAAGDAPRVRHVGGSNPFGEKMLDGGQVIAERALPAESLRILAARGHTLGYEPGMFGGYQGIRRDDDGIYHAGSDSRKDGQAAGY